MDIEKLTKSQIVLLTLLVSFMTSIATGILTVPLLQQAPPEITKTVNREVDHTGAIVIEGGRLAEGTGAEVITPGGASSRDFLKSRNDTGLIAYLVYATT